jgi:putative transposase
MLLEGGLPRPPVAAPVERRPPRPPKNVRFPRKMSVMISFYSEMAALLAKRRFPAHASPVERDREPVVVFATVCTREPSCNLADDSVHLYLRLAWTHSDYWRVGSYVIMPDHVHLFCVPGIWPPVPILKWVTYWRSLVSRGLAGHGPLMEGGLPRPPVTAGIRWQRDCWDTQMRSYSHYVEKRAYVRQNPVRRGLVSKSEEWLYQGELHLIRW